jgi:hypothetical protein
MEIADLQILNMMEAATRSPSPSSSKLSLGLWRTYLP